MKYTPDLFLLPDGSPMDAQEIASMLNSWAGSPDVGKKPAVKHQFTPSGAHMSIPIMAQRNIGVTLSDLDINNPPQYDGFHVRHIPVYKEDMIDFLMHKVYQHNRLGQNITAIAVGYDIWVNLEDQLHQRQRITDNTHTPGIITLGQLTIYCTNTPGQVDVLYSRANQIREFNE